MQNVPNQYDLLCGAQQKKLHSFPTVIPHERHMKPPVVLLTMHGDMFLYVYPPG